MKRLFHCIFEPAKLMLIALVLWKGEVANGSEHPRVLVTAVDHDAIIEKIEKAPWAKAAYAALKARVDECLLYNRANPHWLSSRLFMHWEERYTTALIENWRWVGGEGHAPVPTPRFDGARHLETKWECLPVDKIKPYNEQNRKIVLTGALGNEEEVDPGQTGRLIGISNSAIMQIAADAAFIYWVTGDESYAAMATDVLWTYMLGYSYVTPPRIIGGCESVPGVPALADVIGSTSFEVIRETILPPATVAYDFLYEYIAKKNNIDIHLIQLQLKRMADRIVAGGINRGNWAVTKCNLLAYVALALEENACYEDNKGSQYYCDLMLDADLPTQRGIMRMLNEDLDAKTGLWPEPPTYALAVINNILEVACLTEKLSSAKPLWVHSKLPDLVFSQKELLYPNGWSFGVGNTRQSRISTKAVELLIALSRKTGNSILEERASAFLEVEIAEGRYLRESVPSALEITQYVAEIKKNRVSYSMFPQSRYIESLNLLIQRNGALDAEHALAASIYGEKSRHSHVNGLAVELYGAGLVMGADPGPGDSYWTLEHQEYYSQPIAHNNVVIGGRSNSPLISSNSQAIWSLTKIPMQVEVAEPFGDVSSLSPNISFVQASLDYTAFPATQQRTLALIRTGPSTGFYFDVFRSKTRESGKNYHDYIYHNIGHSLKLYDQEGKFIPLVPSSQLVSSPKAMPGYKYLKNERSAFYTGNIRGTFLVNMPEGSRRFMDIWMPTGTPRQIFSAEAPPDRAARESIPFLAGTSMPTLVVRQGEDAWTKPFVAIFEPWLESEGPGVCSVRQLSIDSSNNSAAVICRIDGDALNAGSFVVWGMQSDTQDPIIAHEGGISFAGSFGVAIERSGLLEELYLAHGTMVRHGLSAISTYKTDAANACVRRINNVSWSYSSSAAIEVSLVVPMSAVTQDPTKAVLRAGGKRILHGFRWEKDKDALGSIVLVGKGLLDPARDEVLSLHWTLEQQ